MCDDYHTCFNRVQKRRKLLKEYFIVLFLPHLSDDKCITVFRIMFIAEIWRSRWSAEENINKDLLCQKRIIEGMIYALVHPGEARCIVIWCYSVNLDHISSIYISLLHLDKYGSRHFREILWSERLIVYLAIVVLNNWGRSPTRITGKITNDMKRAIEESNKKGILILEVRNPSYLVKSGRIHRDLLAFDEKGSVACPTICCWKIVGGRRPQLNYSRIGCNEDGL